MIHHRGQTTTPGTTFPTLCDKCVGSFMSHRIMKIEGLWDGAYGLSSLSEKTRESKHLQMSLQRQHFLGLSYLKTLSVGQAGVELTTSCMAAQCSTNWATSVMTTKGSYDHRRYELNFSNCVEKPEKFRTSAEFEPVTLQCRCDTLTN